MSTTSTPILSPNVAPATPTTTIITEDLFKRMMLFRPPVPLPGTPGTPYFEGKNITEFLERYEDICNNYQVTKAVSLLPRYCEASIGRIVKTLPEFISEKDKSMGQDIALLRKVLLREFHSTN